MELIEAVYKIMIEAKQPLHYKEIARRILNANLLSTIQKVSDQSINALIVMDIYTKRDESHFIWVDMGVYAINPKFLALHTPKEEKIDIPTESVNPDEEVTDAVRPKIDVQVTSLPPRLESVPEIVDRVLAWYAHKEPMHYTKIAEKAFDKGLIKVSGDLVPGIIYGRILGYTDSWRRRGEYPRFFANGTGHISLTRWSSNEVQVQVNNYISEVREILKARLTEFTPKEFEEIAGILLGKIGLDEVTVHVTSDDGTTSLSGVLAAADFLRIKVTIRIIHTIKKIDSVIIQNLKSSLLDGEYGIVISSGDFMQSAWDECIKQGPVFVGIIDGNTFANLLIEHDLMVARDSFDLIVPSGKVPFFAQELVQKKPSPDITEGIKTIVPPVLQQGSVEPEIAESQDTTITGPTADNLVIDNISSLTQEESFPDLDISDIDIAAESAKSEEKKRSGKNDKKQEETEEEISLDDEDDDLSQLMSDDDDIDLDSLDINQILGEK